MDIREHNNKIQVFIDDVEKAREFQDEFSAFEPNYKNNTRYRMGLWNGKRNFYKVQKVNGGWVFTVPYGLKGRAEDFTGIKLPENLDYNKPMDFLKRIIPELPFKPYKHQLKMFLGLSTRKTHLGVASVGSGKSLVLYLLTRYFRESNKKILILVPTVDLVMQLKNDFSDYNASVEFLDSVQQIGGEFKDKDVHKPIVISTWQSAVKSDLSKFDVVLNDEVHLSKADVLLSILNNPFEIKLGLTGTPPIIKLDALLLEQNFGQPKTYITAKGLIELGLATDLSVVTVFLNQKVKKMKYQDEVAFIKKDHKRNQFIKKLVKKLHGPCIGLYQHTEHGETIFETVTGEKLTSALKNNFERQKELGVFFLYGGTKAPVRKQILDYFKNLDGSENVFLIGQAKLLSTGINLKPLRHLIFLSSSKSFTQVIQSIGRVLRLHDSKSKALIWDLVDVHSEHRKEENYALKHFWHRLSFYEMQEFDVIEKEVNL